MESFFSRYQFDQIIENHYNEYSTFFTMYIDDLSLANFYLIFAGDIFEDFDDEDYYEERDNNDKHDSHINTNYISESILMANEDINILKINKCDFVDMEIIEYNHLNDFLRGNLPNDEQFLDKITTLYNLKSLSKLEDGQELSLDQNIKKIDVTNGHCIFWWISRQSITKIIPYVILTVNSALKPELLEDLEIFDYLNQSTNGLDKLINLYPKNEELINIKILIKSKLV